MARLIENRSAAEDIVRSAQQTTQNAAIQDDTLLADAEEYLRDALALGKRLVREIEDAEELLGFARARQHRGSRVCDTVLHEQHDALFNRIGRRTRDLLWNKTFLRGVSDVTERTYRFKPDAMRALAVRIETVHHQKIPEAVAKAAADAIRDAASALDGANEDLVPVVSDHKVLLAQYYANARYLQVQLSRLKKHWASQGLTEQEIHEIIPAVGVRPSRPEPETPVDAPTPQGAQDADDDRVDLADDDGPEPTPPASELVAEQG